MKPSAGRCTLTSVINVRRLSTLALLSACTGEATPPVRDAATDAKPPIDVVGPRNLRWQAPPMSTLAEPGVRREVMYVDTPPSTANPTTRAETPVALNRVQVLRYRVDTPTASPVRAVVIAMPGFLGGAGSFDPLARALVRRSAAAGTPVEVWSLDRRSNQLEDLRGMDLADAMRDPEIAADYYLRNAVTIDGQSFAGYRNANDPALSYMAEWGLASTLRDLRAVVARVASSRTHAVLLGHSLGASIVEAYAAWDFDDSPGFRSIAGLVLVDGVASGQAVSETAWRMGGGAAPGGFASTGVDVLRQRGPWFVALPVLGVRALVVSEIVARRAALAPDGIVRDEERDEVFRLLLGVNDVPPLTNGAALGFAFDDTSCPLAFARMSIGTPVGPLRMQPNLFGGGEQVSVPSSATEMYRWLDAAQTMPREFTPLANAAAAWATTPSNFGEWYFPTRLGLDVSAVGNLSLARDSWQVREGIRTMHGAEIDVPVMGISAALVGRSDAFDRVRERVASTLGSDLPAGGAPRSSPMAFRAMHVSRMTHLDPLTGADNNPENPVPDAVLNFVTSATAGNITPSF
jgi:hypothetical protein